jgi:hypothetical protein
MALVEYKNQVNFLFKTSSRFFVLHLAMMLLIHDEPTDLLPWSMAATLSLEGHHSGWQQDTAT